MPATENIESDAEKDDNHLDDHIELVDDLDNEESTQSQPKQRRKKKEAVTLSDEQEETLVNWIRDNPIIYDK